MTSILIYIIVYLLRRFRSRSLSEVIATSDRAVYILCHCRAAIPIIYYTNNPESHLPFFLS